MCFVAKGHLVTSISIKKQSNKKKILVELFKPVPRKWEVIIIIPIAANIYSLSILFSRHHAPSYERTLISFEKSSQLWNEFIRSLHFSLIYSPNLCWFCAYQEHFGLWSGHFPSGSAVKNPPAMQEMQEKRVWPLGQEDPLEK